MNTSKFFKKQDFRFQASEMTNGLYLTLVLDEVKRLMANVDMSILEDYHFKYFNKGISNFIEYATSGVFGFGLKKGTDFDSLLPIDGMTDDEIDSVWNFIYENDGGEDKFKIEALRSYYEMVEELENDYNAYKREISRSRFYNSEE